MWQVKSSGIRNGTSMATKLNYAVLEKEVHWEQYLSLEIHERFKRIKCEAGGEGANEDQHESVSFSCLIFIKSVSDIGPFWYQSILLEFENMA